MIKSKALIEKVNNRYFDLKSRRYTVKKHNDEILNNNAEYVNLLNELGTLKFNLAKAEYQNDHSSVVSLNEKIKLVQAKISNLTYLEPLEA